MDHREWGLSIIDSRYKCEIPCSVFNSKFTQPTCAVQSGSISVTTQSGVEYSLDGTTYQASNTFSGLTRMIILYMFRAPVIILV
jgi:hypothetical protein